MTTQNPGAVVPVLRTLLVYVMTGVNMHGKPEFNSYGHVIAYDPVQHLFISPDMSAVLLPTKW